MVDIPGRPGDDDSPSLSEQLRDAVGMSKVKRSQDDECDDCGTSEGSVITSKEEGFSLCRSCFNDPDVLEDYVDG